MEYFGSRPEATREVSLAEVDRGDVYVGIIGHRYGSGITEAEYERAVERELPILLYHKQADGPIPPDHQEQTQAGKRRLLQSPSHPSAWTWPWEHDVLPEDARFAVPMVERWVREQVARSSHAESRPVRAG